jgi:hypothetical protein
MSLARSQELLERSKQRLKVLQDASINNQNIPPVKLQTPVVNQSPINKQESPIITKPPIKIDPAPAEQSLEKQFDSMGKLSGKMQKIHESFIANQSILSSQQSKLVQNQTMEQIQFIQKLQDTQLSWELSKVSRLSSFYNDLFQKTVQQVNSATMPHPETSAEIPVEVKRDIPTSHPRNYDLGYLQESKDPNRGTKDNGGLNRYFHVLQGLSSLSHEIGHLNRNETPGISFFNTSFPHFPYSNHTG